MRESEQRLPGRDRARIALVVPSLVNGGGVPGVASFLFRVLESSDQYDPFLVSLAMSSRDGASVRLLEPASWMRGVQVREGVWEGRPYFHVGTRLVEFEFMRYAPRRALTDLLEKADLVQVVAGAPCWVLPTMGSEIPVFLHVATLTRQERARRHRIERGVRGLWRQTMTAVTERIDRIGLSNADRIFVMNRWMEKEAMAVAGSHRVVYAPPGVDVERFRPRSCADQCEGANYILSVARFGDPRKNPELLFRSYAQLTRRVPCAPELWLAGRSDPPETAQKIAADIGIADRTRYLGSVSDDELTELYRNAKFLVLSSDEEGFGLVLIEAMASGIPVVSTACGGPEDIVSDGEDGFLVPTGDADALAEAMERLVGDSDLRRRMGGRARRTAVNGYSLPVAGKRFLEGYDDMLADPLAEPLGASTSPGRSVDSEPKA